mmetsp:Transcript_61568/g.169211  ORF Transcript_61568/g.169211 Transcript_61568/m.169211 type:complete len:233 (+) Transcript_61568:909-1607(+)
MLSLLGQRLAAHCTPSKLAWTLRPPRDHGQIWSTSKKQRPELRVALSDTTLPYESSRKCSRISLGSSESWFRGSASQQKRRFLGSAVALPRWASVSCRVDLTTVFPRCVLTVMLGYASSHLPSCSAHSRCVKVWSCQVTRPRAMVWSNEGRARTDTIVNSGGNAFRGFASHRAASAGASCWCWCWCASCSSLSSSSAAVAAVCSCTAGSAAAGSATAAAPTIKPASVSFLIF